MKNPLPMIIAGTAALLLLGKKKKVPSSAIDQGFDAEEVDVEESEPLDRDRDSEELPRLGEVAYGVVDKGVRKDRRGHFPWQIYHDSDGYRARIMLDDSRFSPVQEEVGIAASSGVAKIMLKNRFNELLLSKYPSEKAQNDPAVGRATPE